MICNRFFCKRFLLSQRIPLNFFFFLRCWNYVTAPVLSQRNSQDINLTTHAWWECGEESENTFYFLTKGQSILQVSAGNWLARALNIWKMSMCAFQNAHMPSLPINPFTRQRTSCPPSFKIVFWREYVVNTLYYLVLLS